MNAQTARFEMRLDQEILEGVDEWSSRQPDSPSRSEAIRRLISQGLSMAGERPQPFSDGERMMLQSLPTHTPHAERCCSAAINLGLNRQSTVG